MSKPKWFVVRKPINIRQDETGSIIVQLLQPNIALWLITSYCALTKQYAFTCQDDSRIWAIAVVALSRLLRAAWRPICIASFPSFLCKIRILRTADSRTHGLASEIILRLECFVSCRYCMCNNSQRTRDCYWSCRGAVNVQTSIVSQKV